MWIMDVKDPRSRLLKWRIKLEEYDYEIVYKKGLLNPNADALSRINTWSRVNTQNPVGVTEEEEKKQILFEYHDATLGSHRGMNKTYKAIKTRFHWTNMRQEIEDYVKKCKSCKLINC
jgi:hypothetical protein